MTLQNGSSLVSLNVSNLFRKVVEVMKLVRDLILGDLDHPHARLVRAELAADRGSNDDLEVAVPAAQVLVTVTAEDLLDPSLETKM